MSKNNLINLTIGLGYQEFKFYEDGHMTMMMSYNNESHTKQELDSIMDSLPSVIKYTYYDQGVMIVTRTDIKNYGEIWNVSYCIKRRIVGEVDFKPGDLVMVLKNVKNEIVYYRQLRRVNSTVMERFRQFINKTIRA